MKATATFARKSYWTLMLVSVVFDCRPVTAQELPPELDRAIEGLSSSDLQVRSAAFYELLQGFGDRALASDALWKLLDAYPGQAERIRMALVTALNTEAAYRMSMEAANQSLSELFSGYWSDLISAVSKLRDPRAVHGLLGAVDTGGAATEGLADICPFAVDALIEKSREPARMFQGRSINQRAGAFDALGACMKRVDMVRTNPAISEKIRAALLAGFEDQDPYVRAAAARAALPFKDEPAVRVKLEQLARSDGYVSPIPRMAPGETQFTVRDAATRVLKLGTDESLFYVVKIPPSMECRVQRGSEAVAGVRFIGPSQTPEISTRDMCTHVDPKRKDPSLCWSVEPENACRQ